MKTSKPKKLKAVWGVWTRNGWLKNCSGRFVIFPSLAATARYCLNEEKPAVICGTEPKKRRKKP